MRRWGLHGRISIDYDRDDLDDATRCQLVQAHRKPEENKQRMIQIDFQMALSSCEMVADTFEAEFGRPLMAVDFGVCYSIGRIQKGLSSKMLGRQVSGNSKGSWTQC